MSFSLEPKVPELAHAKDLADLMDRVAERYPEKWVAILEDGSVIAGKELKNVYSKVSRKHRIVVLLHPSRKGELLFR